MIFVIYVLSLVIMLCKMSKDWIIKIKKKEKWYLHKPQLLPAADISIQMLAEIIQKTFHVCLQVVGFRQTVQRNERRDVMTADPQRRLQVQLQIVGLQEGAFVAGCQGHAHSFTVKGLSDVEAALEQQHETEAGKSISLCRAKEKL